MDYIDLLSGTFKLGGRGENNTWDCFGLVREVLKRMGKQIPNYKYEDNVDDQFLGELIEKEKLIVAEQVTEPQEGDIVVLQVTPVFITHAGIMLDKNRFLHITRKTRVCVERIDSQLWNRRVRGFYRPKDIKE